MVDENQITASLSEDGKNILINLPIDLLVHTQLYRDDSYTVTDPAKMAEFFLKYGLSYDEEEDGSTALHNTIDGFFDWAYEFGETWLEQTDDMEDEEE